MYDRFAFGQDGHFFCKKEGENLNQNWIVENLRQMICSGAAIAVAVAVYLGLTPLLGHETAGWVCIVAAAPIAAAGFFTYDCLTFEKFLLIVIDSTIIRNDWRLWKTENTYTKKKSGKKGDKH